MSFTFGQNKMYIWQNSTITDSMDITNDLKISFKSASPIPINGLVAYYPFTDSSANDFSGFVHNGIKYNVLPDTDRFNNPQNSLRFNGSNSKILVNYSTDFDITSKITLSVWIKYNGINAAVNETIVGKWESSATLESYSLDIQSKKPRFILMLSNGSVVESTSPNDINLMKWTHLVCVYDGTVHKVFINGVQVVSKNITGLINTGNAPLVIGASNSGYLNWFNGSIDDVRIYKSSLSDSEIQTLYHEGGWTGN